LEGSLQDADSVILRRHIVECFRAAVGLCQYQFVCPKRQRWVDILFFNPWLSSRMFGSLLLGACRCGPIWLRCPAGLEVKEVCHGNDRLQETRKLLRKKKEMPC